MKQQETFVKEKCVSLSNIERLANELLKQPAYQHDGEDFYAGVTALKQEIESVSGCENTGAWVHDGKPVHCNQCGFAPKYSLAKYEDGYSNCRYCPNCGALLCE